MTIVLHSPFATAEDAARILGVSKTRLKRIQRLMATTENGTGRSKGKKIAFKGAKVAASARKTKNVRGKAKKAAR